LRTTIPTAVLTLYLGLVLHLTLVAFPIARPPVNLIPFRTILDDLTGDGRGFLVNFCGNLVGFMPIGALLPLVTRDRLGLRACLAASFTFSMLIESSQFALGTRIADVDDLILNTVGGGLGFALLTTPKAVWGPLTLPATTSNVIRRQWRRPHKARSNAPSLSVTARGSIQEGDVAHRASLRLGVHQDAVPHV
jgi:hypothetical protein